MKSAGVWMPVGGLELEPNAHTAAVSGEGCLAVIAGPGSGKTELLAQRADFLLQTNTCHYPQKILAISFKVDAARNLKQRVRRRASAELAARVDSFTFHAFAKHIIDVFRPVLRGASALHEDYVIGDRGSPGSHLGFNDMVPRAVEILKASPVARLAIARTYSDIFLDEFQDCTTQQYELLRAMTGDGAPRLIAVGDTKQSLMQWAGALEGVFERFAMDYSIQQPLILYVNHRSDAALRRLHNRMVIDMEPRAAVDPASITGHEGVVALHEYEDEQAEAEAIAELLATWAARGDGLLDAAVLVRSQASAMTETLRRVLKERDVPFRLDDGREDVVEGPLGHLITDFLHVVSGGRRPEVYVRLMDAAESPWLFYGESEERAVRLRQEVESARRRLVQQPDIQLVDLVTPFLTQVGDIVLSALVRESEERSVDDVLSDLLRRVDSRRAASGSILAAVADLVGSNAVRIMTIHKSKGLEFDQVVILGVEREAFWGQHRDIMSAFFVAASRARHELHLTVCGRRSRPAGVNRWTERRSRHELLLSYVSGGLGR